MHRPLFFLRNEPVRQPVSVLAAQLTSFNVGYATGGD
jgi:hypothetical protein